MLQTQGKQESEVKPTNWPEKNLQIILHPKRLQERRPYLVSMDAHSSDFIASEGGIWILVSQNINVGHSQNSSGPFIRFCMACLFLCICGELGVALVRQHGMLQLSLEDGMGLTRRLVFRRLSYVFSWPAHLSMWFKHVLYWFPQPRTANIRL